MPDYLGSVRTTADFSATPSVRSGFFECFREIDSKIFACHIFDLSRLHHFNGQMVQIISYLRIVTCGMCSTSQTLTALSVIFFTI